MKVSTRYRDMIADVIVSTLRCDGDLAVDAATAALESQVVRICQLCGSQHPVDREPWTIQDLLHWGEKYEPLRTLATRTQLALRNIRAIGEQHNMPLDYVEIDTLIEGLEPESDLLSALGSSFETDPEDVAIEHDGRLKTPIERWGTCCPHDPECDHSFLPFVELRRHLHTPITDEEAEALSE